MATLGYEFFTDISTGMSTSYYVGPETTSVFVKCVACATDTDLSMAQPIEKIHEDTACDVCHKRLMPLEASTIVHSPDFPSVSAYKVDGQEVVNVTMHPLSFGLPDGSWVDVPPSGFVVNATVGEQEVGHKGKAQIVRSTFIPDVATATRLAFLTTQFSPETIIVGSLIAVQSYPNLVHGLVSLPGMARNAAKRVDSHKFSLI